ncbi:hypothetical protein SELMODRAFT_420273 [Selaginella moellendorffii]|uniref:Uncharacterized protein n=1 Tax=Selaginella moellendorffii TaxID=88036 RepID=D8SBG9_SELML|nr:hypothetical protein SELMODRAFT_420273 [Selaginella moellendorffii]
MCLLPTSERGKSRTMKHLPELCSSRRWRRLYALRTHELASPRDRECFTARRRLVVSSYCVFKACPTGQTLACPPLRTIPQVVMIHGESNVSQLQSVMLLVYPTGVRVVVHTANLINIDWNNKNQGLWMQDFPFKSMTGASDFENDLVDYLTALEWLGCTVDVQHHGKMKINVGHFQNFDFSNAAVRLVASYLAISAE